ncbi:MAG: TetR family transcriptional regulator C-terminal domain-containing protein, partial [Bacteroidota bacterium]
EAYNKIFKNLIQQGINNGEFNIQNIDITVRFINGIISESMRLLTANSELMIEEEVVSSIFKLLK